MTGSRSLQGHSSGDGGLACRYPPPRARRPVLRPHLFERLDDGAEGLITVVTGPPGAGKTVLLSTWLDARRSREPVAWLTLEASDGYPARFWGDVLSLVGDASGERLRGLPDPGEHEFVGRLVAVLGRRTMPVTVILDDYEQLHSRAVSESLDRFLRSPQRCLRFVIASRLDPGLSLQRLRLEGRLTELRGMDLALSRGEASQLFAMSGLRLSTEQVAQLHVRTEGWAGGLSLAALSLRGHPDPEGFVRSFAGDERTVADYLAEEVLNHLPAEVRDFMLRTSVVEALDPGLANALTGRQDGAQTLELLERSNAFLVALDDHRQRYRYHPMFLELLRSQLRYRMPEAFTLEHRRAARWFAARNSAAAAVGHAIAAGDLSSASKLLSEHWLALLVRGQGRELGTWIDGLAHQVIADSAELAVAGAGAALARGDLEQADACLALADANAGAVATEHRGRYGRSRAVAAMLAARLRDDHGAGRAAAQRVLAGHRSAPLPGDTRAVAHLHLAIAEQWLPRGDPGLESLHDALELSRRESSDYLVLDCLAQLAMFTALGGALTDAGALGRAAVELAMRNAWEEHPATAAAYLALAVVELDRAAPAAAEEQLARAVRSSHAQSPSTLCLIELSRSLLLSRTDITRAIRVARGAANEIERRRLPPALAASAGFLEAAFSAQAGQADRAHAALARGRVEERAPVEFAVVCARLALAAADPAQAVRHLEPALAPGSRAVRQPSHVEALGLAAVATHLSHDDPGALELVERALRRAQPEGLLAPLLAIGSPLSDLIKRRIRAGTAHRALAGELVERLANDPDASPPGATLLLLEPLSDREEAVLRYLPTIMSKAEIASELFVSVNTVKTHTKNIYRKLGVSTRTDAVRRAKVLRLT